MSCAGRFPPPSVALLPFDNETNNIEASDQVRKVLYDEMVGAKFNLVPLSEVDSFLKKKGVSDGGQLPVVSVQEMRTGIGADYFLYGVLNDFGFRSLVVWTQTRVALSSVIKSGCSQEVVFSGKGVARVNHAGFEAAVNTTVHAPAMLAQGLVSTGMKYEGVTRSAAKNLIKKIPKALHKRRQSDQPLCP